MQNFSNLLNQIENKRLCHGFNGDGNQMDNVGSTSHVTTATAAAANIHTSDNNLNSTYASSSSNLANSNGSYEFNQCLGFDKMQTIANAVAFLSVICHARTHAIRINKSK